jgi:GR25 family glycosyltransferase involved in LPS biosynthesis
VTAIGIVAHTARSAQAQHLADLTGAAFISFDDGTLGCAANHTQAWQQLVTAGTEWVAVLEDDAIPVNNFRAQLEQALAVAPSPIVSLYLGTSRPKHWQHFVTAAVHHANQADVSWLTATHLLHCVGVAVRTEHAPLMAAWCSHLDQPLDDHPVGQHLIAYTWPSLVDHADETTVVLHPDGQTRDRPRVAHRVGTRGTWTDRTVQIPTPVLSTVVRATLPRYNRAN